MDNKIIPRIDKGVFARKEKFGVTLLQTPNCGAKFLNTTSSELFELIDGKRNVAELYECWAKKYTQVSSQELRTDFLNCLYSMKNIGFILWKGDIEMSDLEKFEIVGEKLYEKTSAFYLNFIKKGTNAYSDLSYVSCNDLSYYLIPNIRTRSIYAQENYFIAIKSNQIVAAISLKGLNSVENPQGMTSFICLDENEVELKKLYEYVKSFLIKEKFNKINFMCNEEILTKTERAMNFFNFQKEAVLRKEFKGLDCYYFSNLL